MAAGFHQRLRDRESVGVLVEYRLSPVHTSIRDTAADHRAACQSDGDHRRKCLDAVELQGPAGDVGQLFGIEPAFRPEHQFQWTHQRADPRQRSAPDQEQCEDHGA